MFKKNIFENNFNVGRKSAPLKDVDVDGGGPKIEDIKNSPKHSVEKEASKFVTTKQALEIMGNDSFLGPEDIKNTFGIEVKEVPQIQFSKERLEQAKKLGFELVLYVDKTNDGKQLTVNEMQSILGNKVSDTKDAFYESTVYTLKNNPSISKETPNLGWKLSGKKIIGSEGWPVHATLDKLKEYLRKSFVNNDTVKELFKKDENFKGGLDEALVPLIYREAFEEFSKNIDLIRSEISKKDDDRECVEKLMNLKISQMCIESCSELTYRMLVHKKKTGEWLLGGDNRDYGGTFALTKSTLKDGDTGDGHMWGDMIQIGSPFAGIQILANHRIRSGDSHYSIIPSMNE